MVPTLNKDFLYVYNNIIACFAMCSIRFVSANGVLMGGVASLMWVELLDDALAGGVCWSITRIV